MTNTRATSDQCRASRRDGSPCGGRPLADGLCFAHSTATDETRRRGGHNRSRAARSLKMLPERLRPVADILSKALEEVYGGELEPRQASAMAAIAGALVRVIQAGEMEERVRVLEAAAREAEHDRGNSRWPA